MFAEQRNTIGRGIIGRLFHSANGGFMPLNFHRLVSCLVTLILLPAMPTPALGQATRPAQAQPRMLGDAHVWDLAQRGAPRQPRIVVDLPTNPRLTTRPIDDGYEIRIADPINVPDNGTGELGYWKWWIFRVDDAKGQQLSFQVVNPKNGHKWKTLNPLYMNDGDLDDLDSFKASMPPADHQVRPAKNGAQLPDTSAQKWHYIPDAMPIENGIRFSHKMQSDRVWIAMRVPCTLGYLRQWYDDLEARYADDPGLNLRRYEIGNTQNGLPMTILTIGEQREHAARPTVLLYGREHAQDQDASFVIQGAAEYLLSDDPKAKRLRNLYTFILIPMLDPQGAQAGEHNRIRGSFYPMPHQQSPEAQLYIRWLQTYLHRDQQRVDLILNIHNHENAEATHVMNWQTEPENRRGREGKLFELEVFEQIDDTPYGIASPGHYRSLSLYRFGGLVKRETDAVLTGWMVNLQGPQRHLSLAELRDLGRVFVLASTEFLADATPVRLLPPKPGRPPQEGGLKIVPLNPE